MRWRSRRKALRAEPPPERQPSVPVLAQETGTPPVEIAPDDPIVAHFQSSPDPVDIEKLELESPAVEALKAAGVRLAIPLVSQGELIGLLNLGPRLSEQDYSGDDRKLLDNLAAQAAPAVRVAQLVRQQEAEVRTRERLEQELRVAQLIQQNFLPKELPRLPGWQVSAHYRPARAVGGDFYDFIQLENGRLGLVIGDVTDKGVPAALVMAATRSVLRSWAQRVSSPSEVLKRVNDHLTPDIPANMFVTCLYGVLDPSTGRLLFANAGHNLPYVHTKDGAVEFRATGMPLGLMADMRYEEHEATVNPGDTILLYSDGLVEAHSPEREMFGFPRLLDLVKRTPGSSELNETLLSELEAFTGPDWEQEDDVTLVALERVGAAGTKAAPTVRDARGEERLIAEFTVPSEPGNERVAMRRIGEEVGGFRLSSARLERLKTAVAEATMNAIEHGNKNQPEKPVSIRLTASDDAVTVRITDSGRGQQIPESETPDLEAKLAGEQTSRGWGLFLIKNMVDEMNIASDDIHHTVELLMYLKGE
ncbi:MAG TPA: SpoIIE family protein phosphatase [Actinomycetota bacterium]|nr:SpoIIE family protein phosphatase [Actinomycetota bacterium]